MLTEPFFVDAEITKHVKLKSVVRRPENNVDKKLPLIVHLHGAGERGNIRLASDSCVSNFIPDKFKDKVVIVSPCCPNDSHWEPDAVVRLVDEMIPKYNINEDKIYLMGYSMGARGTWDIATEYPNKFAAIAPFSGFSCYLKAARIANLPTWIFHSEDDNVVPFEESWKMWHAMREFGGKPRLTKFEDKGHGGWYGVYSNEQFYEWLFSQKRKQAS